MSTNMTGEGSLEDGAMFGITIKDDGTSRTLSWGSKFASYSSFALPTSTAAGKTLSFAFRWYDTSRSVWLIRLSDTALIMAIHSK